MKNDPFMTNHQPSARKWKWAPAIPLSALMAGWLCFQGAQAAFAQSAPADLSPNVQEVLKLTKAHMGDDVVLAYIHNSGVSYNLSADDILYLNSQGVSQPVISALLQAKSAVPAPPPSAPPAGPSNPSGVYPPPESAPPPGYAPPPTAPPQVIPPGGVPPAGVSGVAPVVPSTPAPEVPEAPPPGSEISLPYFQSQLAPYGQWIYLPQHGQCWVPSIQSQVPGWRPYLNSGHWEYTDNGWYWASDYPWGEYVFHYGRWTQVAPYGWVWVPGYYWGPAWVCWRNAEAEGFCAWAPLPPGAIFEPGFGLVWHGVVAADVDFGLPASYFVFVPFDHFWAHDYVPWVAASWRVPGLFRVSVVLNGFGFVGGHFFIGGLGRDRIAFRTHFAVRPVHVAFHDARIARDHERAVEHREFERREAGRPGGARDLRDHHER